MNRKVPCNTNVERDPMARRNAIYAIQQELKAHEREVLLLQQELQYLMELDEA